MDDRSGLEDLSVKEIMDRWPRTASAFIARRMHCVGCPIGPFHTLADAAMEHQLDAAELLEVVQREARAGQAPGRRR
ncbi:DUF1858 domain-containing protein [Devosia sp.]|uniref:DUF1858 domain-containing protein n=1 Tax=Devosia sp. TaxID=1871048 RepID=UPI0019DD6C12|nr:DUF1858 domain-containing protein [Devosia sp.]MBE0580677.1 DUF1858 domain-containing protein [Devosia sp.]